MSDRRIFAEGLDGPPDGICLDADGGVWVAMTLAHTFERIEAGGTITDRIEMGDRTAIACTLGGPERRTLFLLSSTDAYPAAADRDQAVTPRCDDCGYPGSRAAVSDSYYELVDGADPLGEKFAATDLVRSTWTAEIQHGAPVSALLVRALEKCEVRDDTRLSRVMIDLLGAVPAEGDLWVRSRIERSGKQIELVSAEMLAPGRDGEPRAVARASGWRLKTIDTAEVVRTSAPPLRPLAEARSRDMKKDWDRNYVHSLDWRWLTQPMSDGPGESWIRPEVDLVKGESMTALERLFAVADDANGIGTKLDIRKWTFMNTDLVVHVHRIPEGEWIGIRAETNYGPDGIGTTIGTLFDESGAVGAIQESVLVRPMPGR